MVFKCDGFLLFYKSIIILVFLCNFIYSFISILLNCCELKLGIICNLIGKYCRVVVEICVMCIFIVMNILYDSVEIVGFFWNELLLS